MQDLPFLALSRALEKTARAGQLRPAPGEAPKTDLSEPAAFSKEALQAEAHEVFDAAVSAVHTGFRHLSKEDIVHPPHRLFDALLARQIAIHIAIHRHQVARNALARELNRNRGQVKAALTSVDRRLRGREFAAAYKDMADRVAAILRERESSK